MQYKLKLVATRSETSWGSCMFKPRTIFQARVASASDTQLQNSAVRMFDHFFADHEFYKAARNDIQGDYTLIGILLRHKLVAVRAGTDSGHFKLAWLVPCAVTGLSALYCAPLRLQNCFTTHTEGISGVAAARA
eukprot:6180799-Pleurochrysis_carterae.AAC.1